MDRPFHVFLGLLKLDGDYGHEQINQKKTDNDNAGDKKNLSIQIISFANSVHNISPTFISSDLKYIDVTIAERVKRNLIPKNIRV